MRVRRFLVAAGTELGRIGAAQLATGRGGDAMLRQYVEQRVDAVIYRRVDELFRDAHRRGLLSTPPELLGEITRGALERLFTSRLLYELERTAAVLLRTTVGECVPPPPVTAPRGRQTVTQPHVVVGDRDGRLPSCQRRCARLR
ncbi:hypothetical protein ACFCYB_19990 [Streptomyces sp. NPDC056309]|uniref:hypothetical protein n=1 Tax=unclassified Streptomyces TaxID=2593676 RepID=UPI0035E0FAB4